MGRKEPKRRLRVVKGLAPEPLPTADLEAAEDILAALVALAYRADHPDLFGAQQCGAEDTQVLLLPIHKVAQEPAGPAREIAPGLPGGISQEEFSCRAQVRMPPSRAACSKA